MSKSVFVMDTPVNCEQCMWFRCSNVGEWFQCGLDYHGITKPYFSNTCSAKCPLLDIPERKDEFEKDLVHHESVALGEATGWNKCLEYILNGGKENEKDINNY